MRHRTLVLAFLALVPLAHPGDLQAQGLLELLQSIRQGGGWVSIPVAGGEGSLRTVAVPVGGLSLSGCVQVWVGNSGRWSLRAQDVLSDERLDVSVVPGESTPFSYAPGPRSQLQVDVRWSEPRDTTLFLWIGLETPNQGERDPCKPVYGSAGG